MRLWEKHRPATLGGIVGQPPVKRLIELAAAPYECCVLLEGPPGTGKTTAALALAKDMDVQPDAMLGGLTIVNAADLRADYVRKLFGDSLRLRPIVGSRWKILVIEELEALPSVEVQRLLKTYLDAGTLPPYTIVVATSNDASGLQRALLQRFQVYVFGGGPHLARAATERLAQVWSDEAPGEPVPSDLHRWGYDEDGCDQYSVRAALTAMQERLAAVRSSRVVSR